MPNMLMELCKWYSVQLSVSVHLQLLSKHNLTAFILKGKFTIWEDLHPILISLFVLNNKICLN